MCTCETGEEVKRDRETTPETQVTSSLTLRGSLPHGFQHPFFCENVSIKMLYTNQMICRRRE